MAVVNMATDVGEGGEGADKRSLVWNFGPELRKQGKLGNQGGGNRRVGKEEHGYGFCVEAVALLIGAVRTFVYFITVGLGCTRERHRAPQKHQRAPDLHSAGCLYARARKAPHHSLRPTPS